MKNKALVVGGGPAGASSALGLLRAGFDVTLREKSKKWTGRVCGAFLSPEAVFHLEELGLLSRALESGAVPVEKVLIRGAGIKPVDLDLGAGSGLAWPRKNLEEMLLAAVQERGGRVLRGLAPEGNSPPQGGEMRATQEKSRAKEREGELVINAAGRFAGEEARASAGWFGWNAEFQGLDRKPGELSLHFYPGGYVGVLTFKEGQSNVCGLAYRGAGKKESIEEGAQRAMDLEPSLKELLREGTRQNPWRMVGPLPFRASMRDGRGALPAGDAAAVGDPFMGEGIGRALGAGPLLLSCLGELGGRAWNLEELHGLYQTRWTQRYQRRLRTGFLARACLRSGFLTRLLLRPALRGPRPLRKLLPLLHGA